MKNFIPFLCIVLLFSCDQKKAQESSKKETVASCETEVIVKDYTGMDGCKFLFLLNDETKLLPAELPKMDFELENNQVVKISYTELKDMASICMMESKAVRIDCIEFVALTGGVKPSKQTCEKLDKPGDSSWMGEIIKKYKPYQIDRYEYLGTRYAYYIDIGTKKMLYDCTGSEICSVQGKAMNECTKQVSGLKSKKTIWQIGVEK